MKIAHCSDVHLGFGRFGGARSARRKEDVINCFLAAVDTIIDRGCRVALFPGDFFDSPDPDNETLLAAITGITRLTREGISVRIISGQHDTPKSERCHIFAALQATDSTGRLQMMHAGEFTEDIDGFRFVYQGWDNIPLDWAALPEGDFLVVHAPYPPAIFSDRHPRAIYEGIPDNWSYLALGDWHERKEIMPGAWYSGGLERLNFGEQGSDCGILVIDTDTGEVTPWDSPARELITIDFDLDTWDRPEEKLREVLEGFESAAIRLRMAGDPTRIDPKCLDFHPLIQREFLGRPDVAAQVNLGTAEVATSWEEFCNRQKLSPQVFRYGRHFLREIGR
ncbi:hypothetical protein LCGC14_0461590 [marine sediment metagenome]|uniref:Calcineurin-like phosphoesterase domain-containing protein n=1 Tax=marine sediment metagenome TaxID=412755 RepID=A0A0F9V1P4_9ZZZZ